MDNRECVDQFAQAHNLIPSATEELWSMCSPQFYGKSDEQITEILTQAISSRPHMIASDNYVNDAEAMCGPGRTLKAMAYFRQTYGATETAATLERWHASANDLRPGINPAGESKSKASKNPWKTGDKAEIVRLLSTLPTATCAAMARSAGKQISGADLRR